MKPKTQEHLLYAAYLIDGVLIYSLLLQNPIFYQWIESNVSFLTKILPPVTYFAGLLWLLVSTVLVLIQEAIIKHTRIQKQKVRPQLSKAGIYAMVSVGFYTGHFIFDNPPVVDLVVICVFAMLYFFSLGAVTKIFIHDKDADTTGNNKMELVKSTGKLLSNEYSFHFKTNRGYVNMMNPFRGIFLVGTAGSGKTFTFIEEIIDQAFRKGYTAFIYDFKFPNLAEYSYNSYLINCKQSKLKVPKFYSLYFKDIRYSNRCNPLHPSVLKEKAFALQASKTILFNINPEWSKKQGEFFSSSAIAINQAIMWFLRLEAVRTGRNISTLPHLIEMASFHNTNMLVEVLLAETEVATIITPIKAAMQAGANEQLAGQIASLQIGLSQIVDKKMYYVMSDSDFSLDINNPDDPKIVILGNDDELKAAYAPALSLYASTVANTINQKNRRHCLYCVDEFPTMYIMNVENLPNTGRSNKICTFLGLQNFYQSEQMYGREASSVINSSFANIVMGQTNDEKTAKFAQNLLGEYEYQKKDLSLQIDSDGGSHSFRTDRKKVINLDDVYELDAGMFLGKVADAGGEGAEKKFFAKFIVEKQKHTHHLPFFNKELANLTDDQIEEMLSEHTLSIKKDVQDMIVRKFFTIKATTRLKGNSEVLEYLNHKILAHDFQSKPIHDFEIQELQRFEARKEEVLSEILTQIVDGCVRTFHETEARGGKAVTEKLSVEEYTLRQNFLAQLPDGEGGKVENPNSPLNLIDRFFRRYATPTITVIETQQIPLEEVDIIENTGIEEEGEEDDSDITVERLNYYVEGVMKLAQEDAEIHSMIEEFNGYFFDELDTINEYLLNISQGGSTNTFDYVHKFIAFNAADKLIRYHIAFMEAKNMDEYETRYFLFDCLKDEDLRELETDSALGELPDLIQLAETVLEGIKNKLQLTA